MVTLEQHTHDGRIDWAAYNKAKVDQGEECRQCGHFILDIWRTWRSGPRLCSECQDAEKPASVRHHRYARCPACRHLFQPDFDRAEGDGKQTVDCPACEKDFRIEVECRFTFTSPAVEARADALPE